MNRTAILIILAAVSPPAFAYGVAALASVRRRRRYRESKARHRARPDFIPSLRPVIRTDEQKASDEALYKLLQAEHEQAKTLQNDSFFSLILASAALLIAFAVSAASVTIAPDDPAFHLYSGVLDLAALVVVGAAFVHAGATRTKWTRQRTLTEFLRQWAVTDFIFDKSGEPFEERFRAFVGRVRDELAAERGEIHALALAFGAVRLREVRERISEAADMSGEDLRYYLFRRPVRQALWFDASRARIVEHQESRKTLMICLFALAALAAATKLGALLLLEGHDAHLVSGAATFVLLTVIGLAAATTSSYAGQNQRSLRHRYDAQSAAVRTWIENETHTIELANKRRRATPSERDNVATAIIAFESLMINELVDWIAISTNDAMELAPA